MYRDVCLSRCSNLVLKGYRRTRQKSNCPPHSKLLNHRTKSTTLTRMFPAREWLHSPHHSFHGAICIDRGDLAKLRSFSAITDCCGKVSCSELSSKNDSKVHAQLKVQYFETKKNQKQVGQTAPVTGRYRGKLQKSTMRISSLQWLNKEIMFM